MQEDYYLGITRGIQLGILADQELVVHTYAASTTTIQLLCTCHERGVAGLLICEQDTRGRLTA
eukprot:1159136-Pelagomonas_calceolata.AAC.3